MKNYVIDCYKVILILKQENFNRKKVSSNKHISIKAFTKTLINKKDIPGNCRNVDLEEGNKDKLYPAEVQFEGVKLSN